MPKTKLKGLTLVMISAVLYGLMPMLARFSYDEGVNVVSVLFYRYFFAFLMLTAFVFVRRISLRLNQTQLLTILIASIVGTMLTTYTLFLSYQSISTGLASTLHFIYPIITTVLAVLIYRENFALSKALALLFSIIGIFLLTTQEDLSANFEGIFWALASGVFYAIYIICAAHKELRKLSPFVVAFYVFGFTTFLFLLWGIWDKSLIFPISAKAFFYLGNLSFWGTFLSVILFFVGMQKTGPSSAAILSTFEPLTGVIIGLFLFKEQLSLSMLAGAFLVLVSVVIIGKSQKE